MESTNNRHVVECGPLVNFCNPGDSIMFDNGLNVRDLFGPKDVKVNISTFFKKIVRQKHCLKRQ